MSDVERNIPGEDLPLAGVRVLEFCHTVMGPTCGLMLADMGAEVIKVEPAPQGDRTRVLSGFVAGAFSYYNRNKKSIGLNLKTEEGRGILYRLVKDADVVAENYGPGTAERLGMGYETLSKINPRLIFCALKGFLPGPYEHRAALDEVAQFMTGLAYMTGPPGQPLRAASSVIDMLGGIFGAMGMGALRQRETTGRGKKITSALFESSAFLVGQYMAGQAVSGLEPLPLPVRRRGWAIYETFDAKDGKKVFLGLTSNNHWNTFCDVFGRPDLKADTRYDTNEKRLDAYDFLRPLVQSVVIEYTVAEIIDLLAPKGIPIGPVGKPSDMFEDPHMNAGGGLLETMMTTGQKAKLPALPFSIDGKRLGLRLDPPKLGEHTHEVMARIGLSKDEVDQLIEREILR
ncbi:MAG: CoA transferase [Alphaproteobacteria bacterium]|nr:CoA transferase [Alphaproteobacteria bacterium]